MRKNVEKAFFQIQWMFWSPAKRYVYLWNRTSGK